MIIIIRYIIYWRLHSEVTGQKVTVGGEKWEIGRTDYGRLWRQTIHDRHIWRFSRDKEDRLQTKKKNIQPKKDCLLRGTNWILEFYCDELTASGPLAEGFVVHSAAVNHVSLPVLRFAPVSIISSTLHAHIQLNVTLIRRTCRRRSGKLPKSNALSAIGIG